MSAGNWTTVYGPCHYFHLSNLTTMDLIARSSARRLRPSVALSRCLHSSRPVPANPLPHPTTPGPPPGPPKPAASTPQERVARKLQQAELVKKGQELKAKPSSALKKRFWSNVHVKQTPGTKRRQPAMASHQMLTRVRWPPNPA